MAVLYQQPMQHYNARRATICNNGAICAAVKENVKSGVLPVDKALALCQGGAGGERCQKDKMDTTTGAGREERERDREREREREREMEVQMR